MSNWEQIGEIRVSKDQFDRGQIVGSVVGQVDQVHPDWLEPGEWLIEMVKGQPHLWWLPCNEAHDGCDCEHPVWREIQE